jgi:hypothetical protein
MSNHDPYSDSPSPLVGFSTTKVYSGIGADIVMESITLKCPVAGKMSVMAMLRHLTTMGRDRYAWHDSTT